MKAKRGGYSSVGQKLYSQSNNPYLPAYLYDKRKPISYINYIDCNGLYSQSLLSCIPTKGYRFLKKVELNKLLVNGIESFLKNIDINSTIGYLIQADFEIPEALQSKFDDLPIAVEMKCVQKEQLSDYQLYFKQELDTNDSIFKTKRLIGDLLPKKDYVCHSRTLKKYAELGVKVTKISKI